MLYRDTIPIKVQYNVWPVDRAKSTDAAPESGLMLCKTPRILGLRMKLSMSLSSASDEERKARSLRILDNLVQVF